MRKNPIINEDGEVRSLEEEDLKLLKPTKEVLPQELVSILPKRGRSPKAEKKISTTIRLDPDVLRYFQAEGKGWQTQINNVLRQYMEAHSEA